MGSRSRDAAVIRPLTEDGPGTLGGVHRRRILTWFGGGVAILAATLVAPTVAPAVVVVVVAAVVVVERHLHDRTRALVGQRVLGAALEGRIADLARLTRAGSRVTEVLTVGDVLEVILDAAFELTGAHKGSVMVTEGDQLRVAVAAGGEAAPLGASVAVGEGLAGRVAATGQPLLVEGAVATWQVDGDVRARRASGSSVIVPLRSGLEVEAVLSLQRADDVPAFTDPEVRALALFAEQAAIAFANARRVERRSEFVATVVHDLKGPLTAIGGFAATLRRTWQNLDDVQRERAIQAIETQSRRMSHLVEEILRTTTIDAGAPLRLTPVDLHGLLQEVSSALPRDVVLRRQGRPIAAADTDALTHVFANLIDNAVKYSEPDTPIELLAVSEGDITIVEVTDHGEGIDEREAPHIFDRFKRAGDSSPGVGLGLHIVRTIVDAHGGEVSVRSRLGEGTTFRVVLPAWRPDEEAELPAVSEPSGRSSG